MSIESDVYKTTVWTGREFEPREARLRRGGQSTVVRVLQAGFCGTDHHALSSPHNVGVSMGHEIVAEIVQLGSNLRSVGAEPLQPGDRVIVIPGLPCGACANCLSYSDQGHLCNHRHAHGWGHYADEEYFPAGGFSTLIELLDTLWVCKVPEGLSLDVAMLAEPLAIAVRVVDRALAGSRPDRDLGAAIAMRAGVVGMGAIGVLVSYVLQTLGAEVLGVETNPWKAQRAAELLAIPVIHTPSREPAAANAHVRGAVGGEPDLDVVFECAGEPEAALTAMLLVRKAGKVVLAGNAMRGREVTMDPAVICRKELDVVGTILAPASVYPKVFRILERFDQRILGQLISHRFALDDINGLLPVVETGNHMKIAVHP